MPKGIYKHKSPTQETIEKRRLAMKGRMPKNINMIAGWNKGLKMPQLSGEKNPFFGKHHTPETIAKLKLVNKGKKHTQEWKDKMSSLGIGNKRALGYKFTAQELKNRAKKFKETFDRIGRKTEVNRLFRTQLQYKLWRMSVFTRDNFTCIWCGSKKNIEADHIKPFAHFPELRLSIDNGRTLCHDCHKKTDTYGSKSRKKHGQK